MTTLAVVQARMTSTRLPGKSLADVQGEPLLQLMLRRLIRAERLDGIVVATSTDDADDPVAALGTKFGCEVFRGPRDDVLARYAGALEVFGCDVVVRLTGDCPLIDPTVVDSAIALQATTGSTYTHNLDPRTFPKGLDVEVVKAETLRMVAAEARHPIDREHVTPLLRRQPSRFPSRTLLSGHELGELRWTVDYPDDLTFVRRLVARLGDRKYSAGMLDVLDAVRHSPSLAEGGLRG